jgi:hypothetical protein
MVLQRNVISGKVVPSPASRKRPVQQQIVNDLQSSGQEEWHAHPSGAADKDGRHHWRDRSTHRPSNGGDACGGGSLIGTHDGHRVGLASRHVHLRNTEPQEQDSDGPIHVGHERDENQQNVLAPLLTLPALKLPITDPSTGLPNRRAIVGLAEREFRLMLVLSTPLVGGFPARANTSLTILSPKMQHRHA